MQPTLTNRYVPPTGSLRPRSPAQPSFLRRFRNKRWRYLIAASAVVSILFYWWVSSIDHLEAAGASYRELVQRQATVVRVLSAIQDAVPGVSPISPSESGTAPIAAFTHVDQIEDSHRYVVVLVERQYELYTELRGLEQILRATARVYRRAAGTYEGLSHDAGKDGTLARGYALLAQSARRDAKLFEQRSRSIAQVRSGLRKTVLWLNHAHLFISQLGSFPTGLPSSSPEFLENHRQQFREYFDAVAKARRAFDRLFNLVAPHAPVERSTSKIQRRTEMSTNPKLAVGIDIATTQWAVTVRRAGKTSRQNFPGSGPQLPSAVLYSPDGNHKVGMAALNAAFKEPQHLCTFFKRGIATSPNKPWNGVPLTPKELTGIQLKHVWSVFRQTNPDVTEYVPELGGTGPREQLQIYGSHPATYGLEQLKVLEEAASLVGDGFHIDGFISEPIAAAEVFRELHGEVLKHGDLVAVLDFGGGTFDTSVMQWKTGIFEPVISGRGDGSLGGLNFTGEIYTLFCDKLGLTSACYDPQWGLNLAADPSLSELERRVHLSLWQKSEEAKQVLSTADEATVYVELPDGLKELTITRQQFDDLCTPLWLRLGATVAVLLSDTAYRWPDITHIISCGGSAMLPGLRDRIATLTCRRPEQVFLASDSTDLVSAGAAHQAFCQHETGHCLAAGLGVRLREVRDDGSTVYRSKFFFRTGEIIPVSGAIVQQLGQTIHSLGGPCTISLELVEAKAGIRVAQAGDLLEDTEVVPLRHVMHRCDLPPGTYDLELGFNIEPSGKVRYRMMVPGLADEMDVLSGVVTDESPSGQIASPRDVALVFDRSDSMAGEKLRAAKDAVHNLLSEVSALDVRVCLVPFGRETELACPLGTPLNEVGQILEELPAGGGTPMAKALKITAEHFLNEASEREKLLILITDGQPNDPDKTKRVAKKVKEHAQLICIGIGKDVVEHYLLELASNPSDYFPAESAAAIAGVFGHVIDIYLKTEGGPRNA